MTSTETAAARYLIPELVAADADVTATPPVPHHTAAIEEYDDWAALRDTAAAALQAALDANKGIICWKCQGRGRILGYSHRSNGLCYSCNGDGFTAKGRKVYQH